jgi:PAS domain S-box-containing protein
MQAPFRSASLHTKLMLAIGLLVALVAGGAGWVLIDHERERRMVELENRATRIVDLYSQSLAQSLWNVDRASIDRQLAAQSPNPELAQLKVTAANYGTVSEVLKLPGDVAGGVVRVRPIEVTALPGAAPQKIGEVRLVLTRAVAEKAIADARRAIVALGAAMVALLYALTFVLLRRMVRGPVGRLEETVDRIAGGNLDARCAVEAGDELGRLGTRVNAMANRLRDSTQGLLDSEANFRGIFENALEGIFRLDRQGRLLEANPAMARLTGHATPAELLAGQARPFTREQVDDMFATLARDGQIAGMELQLARADGSPRWVQLNARGHGGAGADAPALEGFVSDLTARKQAEADRLALRDAEAASRAKSEFLAFMSHELRTPLNAVLGYAQILRREPQVTPRQQHGLATIQASGEHLLSLINDLLDLAKIEVGKLELNVGAMAFNSLLATVSAIVRVKADEKQLDFRCEADSELPPMVHADEQRIRQVLLNLLSNAIKFTDAGNVWLRVTLAERLGAAVRVRFEVRDTGVGMDDAQLERLFVAFEQVGDPRRRAAGSGLGLSISQRLVGLMGSRIHAQSSPGEGSRFWFELALEVAAGEAPGLTPAQGAAGYAGPRRRILVAEDADPSRAMLVDLLRPFGFIVDEAADGQQALEVAGRAWPDLVLMDIKMPKLSGIEAVRALRRLRPPSGAAMPPVIMLSASGTRIDYVAAQGAGAEDILHKPVDHRRLLDRIGELLQLEWTFAHAPPPEPTERTAPTALLALPRDELARLLELARAGNMRRIREHVQSLAAADPQYGPLAERVLKLAAGYQSRTILELVESMVTDGVPS